jgi:NhaA family Na+:H+ antiporter
MSILLASLAAGACGFLWLKLFGRPVAGDDDMDAMDFEGSWESGRGHRGV